MLSKHSLLDLYLLYHNTVKINLHLFFIPIYTYNTEYVIYKPWPMSIYG